MPYLLDANVFIQAKNLHYGFDFCPAFWDWLLRSNAEGKVYSIAKVGDELIAGTDELSPWAEEQGGGFFIEPDSAVVPALTTVSTWATTQRYEPAYWLVAHALAHRFTVVTHEVPSESARKIKIPNACLGLDVQFVTPFQMLSRERARFVLGE